MNKYVKYFTNLHVPRHNQQSNNIVKFNIVQIILFLLEFGLG